jgi:two-component system cell cycle sensor histidine kinase/response regulator CckA
MKINGQEDDAAIHEMTADQAMPERRESREQFRELMAHLQQVFWIKNVSDDAVLYISPAYATISGRTCQSLYENFQTFLDSVHPEDRERVAGAMAGQAESGGYEEEYRILRPDGAIRWIWARSYPVCDGQGQIMRFAGIAEDITERKLLELDRARLAAIVEYSEDAIVSMSLDGIVISWNYGAERRYGYTYDEMIGRPISVLFPPEHYQEYLHIMKKARKGEAIPSYDTVRKRKDGTLIHLSVSISPIETRSMETVGATKIAHDITKVKQLEEQFRQAQKMEAMGRLASGLAHEFNNLITVISGYSELLLHTLPPGVPARELIKEIKNAGDRAASLTRQLLSFSRKRMLVLSGVDLNAVVANSEKILKQLVGEDVDMVTVLDPALGRVMTDTVLMEQVLMNLVINARDAMPQGGKLTIETANTVLDQSYGHSYAEVKPGHYVMLTVSDTGSGIDDQTKIRIFEPFFTTKEGGKGTGLGLAMIDGFIKQSGGHVFVYSEPGLGSTFKICLPEVEDAPSAAPLPPAIGKTPHGDETILLVENDAAVRSLARHVLQTYGYRVLEAAQGEEAVRLAETHQGTIHLLVSDMVMPGINGLRLAERVVALKPGVKVLFLFGCADEAMVRHGIMTSEIAFLQKPFTPVALVRKVRNSLDQDDASKARTLPQIPNPDQDQ